MSEQRLIDANFLAECFKMAAERIGSEQGVFCGITIANIGAMLEDGTLGITVDAVPRKEYDLLVCRLKHLLESDYIRSFDEVELGKYKRDIREADRENRHGRWINESHGYRNCSECGCEHPILDSKGFHLDDRYCPDCGAKMEVV